MEVTAARCAHRGARVPEIKRSFVSARPPGSSRRFLASAVCSMQRRPTEDTNAVVVSVARRGKCRTAVACVAWVFILARGEDFMMRRLFRAG